MDITTSLKQYGLTDMEAKIYITLLKLVETSVYQLAKEAKIPRTSAYSTLERLKNKGLVLTFRKNNVLYYTPENPKRLSQILHSKLEIINNIMPQMRALIESPGIKPVIKLYEGKEGMKIVWEDILETLQKEKLSHMQAITAQSIYKVLPKFFPKWVKKRVELGIKVQLILPNIPESYELVGKQLREVKFLPKGHKYQSSLGIYADKLAFFSLKEKQIHSVILESLAITEMFREFFLSMWEVL